MISRACGDPVDPAPGQVLCIRSKMLLAHCLTPHTLQFDIKKDPI